MTFSITGASFKSTFMFARSWYTGHNALLAARSPTTISKCLLVLFPLKLSTKHSDGNSELFAECAVICCYCYCVSCNDWLIVYRMNAILIGTFSHILQKQTTQTKALGMVFTFYTCRGMILFLLKSLYGVHRRELHEYFYCDF